jgi:N6-adenosine-specific RNA methylase IME4
VRKHLGKYKIILADPPWPYSRNYGGDPKNGGIQYPTMSIQDLKDLSPLIKQITNRDSLCLMWATFPKLKEAIEVLESWGYGYKTVIFTWLKRTKSGKVYSGMGNYSNGNQEIVLLGRRGKGCQRIRKDIKQVIEAPRGRHSEKPKELHSRIEALFGDVPRIELFARECVPGWVCLGNEISGKDIRDELKELNEFP